MPQKFTDFAKSTLVKPLVVNVGRAGAANLDVIQVGGGSGSCCSIVVVYVCIMVV